MRITKYLPILLAISLLAAFAPAAKANHIVGGEFELIYLGDFLYEVRLIQYRDNAQTFNTFIDESVNVSIFRKSDNIRIGNAIDIPFFDTVLVEYTQPDCAIGQLSTLKVIYSRTLFLDPDNFSDPGGYYLSYERCCRNRGVRNIIAPEASGQTYILDFPPVTKNGEVFVNSSPTLFPPLSDYACQNQFFFVDFQGTDLDGDSLVYSLATPINGFASQVQPAPIASPGPYPLVNFIDGVDELNMVPGDPSLKIDTEGLLTVTAADEGLYVFSVLCEEFRDGEKIGQVVRDFQMLVVFCPEFEKPALSIKRKNSSIFLNDADTVTLRPGDERGLDLFVTDPDPDSRISIRAKPVNFRGNINDIITVEEGFVAVPGEAAELEAVLPECPLGDVPVAIVDFIAMDDACAVPLMDTLRLAIEIIPPPNTPARFSNNDATVFNIREGDLVQLDIRATDAEGDSMEYQVIPADFDVEEFGLEITEVSNQPGLINLGLNWDTDCQRFDFVTKDTFDILFVVEDLDLCGDEDPDTINVKVTVELPPNTDPVVTTTLPTDEQALTVTLGTTINFDVLANDTDGDIITLEAFPQGFEFSDVGATFNNATGPTSLRENFRWSVACSEFDLAQRDTFDVVFVATDEDKCKEPNADTTVVKVKLVPPPNTEPFFDAPEAEVIQGNPEQLILTVRLQAGQQLNLPITAVDDDGDLVTLRITDLPPQLTLADIGFTDRTDVARVTSNLVWDTGCGNLGQDFAEQSYIFAFAATDDDCFEVLGATFFVQVVLFNPDPNFDDVFPANVFTPNGDGTNETYFVPSLPPDNCRDKFERIRIFNRWGRKVYEADTQTFDWDGGGVPQGVYYYLIEYNNYEYRGSLSVIR